MEPLKLKQKFLRRVANLDQILPLFDSLPDVAFFVKDRQCRMLMNNLRAIASCGVATEKETLGKVGHEFFPDERMMLYLQQDEQVMKSGKPILNAICPAPERGSNALILFSKVPLRDRQGRVIGLAGIWRELKGLQAPPPTYGKLSRVVQLMHDQFAEPLTIEKLAAIAGMSRSQFDRQFQKLLGATPRDYLLRVRINAACHLLAETDRKTTEIALDTGFYDHSHFSRTFRRVMGSCPQAYRRKHTQL